MLASENAKVGQDKNYRPSSSNHWQDVDTGENGRDATEGWISAIKRRWRLLSIPVAIKLAISIGIMITIGMTLLGAVIIHNQTELLDRQIHTFGRTIVTQMAESAKEPLLAEDTLLLDVLASNLGTAEDVIGTAIFTAERTIVSKSGTNPFELNAPFASLTDQYLDGTLRALEWQWSRSPKGYIDASSFMSPVRFKDVIVGHVVISFSRAAMSQSIDDAVQSIITATTLLIVLGIIMSYLLGRRLSRPIHHLVNASRAIGLGQYNFRIHEQRNDELGHLMNSLNSMAKGMLHTKKVEDAFSRHVSPTVAKEIISNLSGMQLGGNHVFGSVMFIDIVGFTAKSETMSPQGVAALLNEFYTNITHTAPLYKGTVDKYMGDCAMLVFGIPEEDDGHVFHAIAYAVFFQRLMEKINHLRISQGSFPVHFRVGLNSGEMLAGNMGSSERVQYTVVGDSVNLASRLCSLAKTDQIIITEETYNLPGIRDKVIASPHQSVQVRGKSQPVSTFLVHDVTAIYQRAMDQQIDKILYTIETASS